MRSKRSFRDPATGDALSFLEFLTRQVQVGVRSPVFILVFNALTIAMFALGWPDWWNYLASWLAIMVEWVVGTYMFGQTRRDALILRQVRATDQHIEQLEQRILDLLTTGVSDTASPLQDREPPEPGTPRAME